jgi:D-alanyl-D-alanine endopeptidase (penicillin-binding protein 7)
MTTRPFLFASYFLAASVFTGQVVADEALKLARLDQKASNAEIPVQLWDNLKTSELRLRSAHALVLDRFGNQLYAKSADTPVPIASVTKLMTAVVMLDSGLSLDEPITITKEDRDLLKLTGSRLKYGATLSRRELLEIALMASENRAASALARTFPGGTDAFVRAMNLKAKELGMHDSHFADATGLNPENQASAWDLSRLVLAARGYPLIREATTTTRASVRPYKDRGPLRYGNTNRLLKNTHWEIELSKTGYIDEAGRCLVMSAEIAEHPLVIVLLDSYGKLSPFGDSNRLRKWIEGALASASAEST